MNIEEAFPSKYLKASDLQDRSVVVKMATVMVEKVGTDQRPILYFVGKDKGLVLNKTNKTTIVDLYGSETDEWTGKTIEIFPSLTNDPSGKQVDCIRIRKPKAQGAAPAAPTPPVDQRMYDQDEAPF